MNRLRKRGMEVVRKLRAHLRTKVSTSFSVAIPAVTVPTPAVAIPTTVTVSRIAESSVGRPIPAVLIQIAPEFSAILADFSAPLPDLAQALSHFGSVSRNLIRTGTAPYIPTQLGLVPVELS